MFLVFIFVTLQVWEHLLTLLASYPMFGLLKGSMSFGGSVFWRMDIYKFDNTQAHWGMNFIGRRRRNKHFKHYT
jgi:hypothetical protein